MIRIKILITLDLLGNRMIDLRPKPASSTLFTPPLAITCLFRKKSPLSLVGKRKNWLPMSNPPRMCINGKKYLTIQSLLSHLTLSCSLSVLRCFLISGAEYHIPISYSSCISGFVPSRQAKGVTEQLYPAAVSKWPSQPRVCILAHTPRT